MVEDWRSRLEQSFRLFSALLDEDSSLSVPYGITAGALLWAVRDYSDTRDLRATLAAIVGEPDVTPLLGAIMLLRSTDAPTGALALSGAARRQFDQTLASGKRATGQIGFERSDGRWRTARTERGWPGPAPA